MSDIWSSISEHNSNHVTVHGVISPIRVPPRPPIQRPHSVLFPRDNATHGNIPDPQTSRRVSDSCDHYSSCECDPGSDSHRKAMCRGCALGFPTAFDRDLHLRKSGACIKCHQHSAESLPEHQTMCDGVSASKLGLKSLSNTLPPATTTSRHNDQVSNLTSNDQQPVQSPAMDPPLNEPSHVSSTTTLPPTLTNTSPTPTSFTPEPDPPPSNHQCLACPSTHPTLSASLTHLTTASCPARLSGPRVARLQASWYPWECATITELDARTSDFEMAYFCPACGALFGAVAGAVAHMEERRERGGGGGDDDDHEEALGALEGGVDRLRRLFGWAVVADGIVDVVARVYTRHACFVGGCGAEELRRLVLLGKEARRAFEGLVASSSSMSSMSKGAGALA